MPLDCVVDQPWPEADRRVGGVLDGNGHLSDDADDALGDRVQVVVVGRARGVMDERGRAELAERVRHQLALTIAVNHANGGARERVAGFIDRGADGGVEGGDASLHGGVGFGFEFEKLDEDEAREFVDDEEDVAVATDGEYQFLEVVVEHARLGSGRRESPRVRCAADASGRTGGARTRASRRGGRGEVLGSIGGCVGGMADLVDADVRAAVEELGGLGGREASDVGGGADAVKSKSPIGGGGRRCRRNRWRIVGSRWSRWKRWRIVGSRWKRKSR